MCRQHHNVNMFQHRRLANRTQDSHAVINRQIQIQENHTRFWLSYTCPVLMDELKCLLTITQNFQFVILSLLIQRVAKQNYVECVIVNDKDSCRLH